MKRSAVAIALAPLALELSSARELQLLPARDFRARDGRPHGLAGWRINAEIAAKVIERIHARQGRTVIDYEHQTLNVEKNGQPAPAAGWFKSVEWREGQGLFATDVEWTDRAKQMIAANEYRYFSPVLAFNKHTGEVVDVRMGAITNSPAIDGMDELLLRAAARFTEDESHQETKMDLKKLAAALGVTGDNVSEDAVIAAAAALKATADKTAGLETEIAALKSATPDPKKFVPVEAMTALQTEVAALKDANARREIDAIVTKALDDGKLIPAQEKWAHALGEKDLAALKSYIETAPAMPALRGTQTGNRGPAHIPAGDIVAACKAEFESNTALRAEFTNLESYTAFKKAEAEGRFRALGAREN